MIQRIEQFSVINGDFYMTWVENEKIYCRSLRWYENIKYIFKIYEYKTFNPKKERRP